MGSGGGGDGGMGMIMMILMQQQMEEQRRQQEAQLERQAFEAAQRGEGQNFQRYQDLITAQNKKVGDQWDMYNQNIDKIMKVNPGYNANKKYTFNPYTVRPEYQKSTNRQQAEANTDLLNKWYSGLDKQSFDDFNMAKKQFEASKIWLAEAQAQQEAIDRELGNAPPGTWGGGGEQVSGEAGADTAKETAETIGDNSGMADVFKNFGSVSGAPSGTPAGGMVGMSGGVNGSGFLGGGEVAGGAGAPPMEGNDNLAGIFGQAVGMGGSGGKKSGSYSIF